MKRFAIYIFIFAIFLCNSCGKTIPQSKLPEIIAEIYLADKYVGTIRHSSYSIHLDSLKIYEPVFNKYGYTGEDYKRSIEKYISRPKKLKIYYEEAKSILEKRKEDIQPQVKEQQQKDSIINIYTFALGNNNLRNNYYKKVQNSKWILFPYSDNRWPTKEVKTDIALPLQRKSSIFAKPTKELYTPFFFLHEKKKTSTDALSAALTEPTSALDAPIPTPVELERHHRIATDTEQIVFEPEQDTISEIDTDKPEHNLDNFSEEEIVDTLPFSISNSKSYPIWLFQSGNTSTDTLRLGSSVNPRMLFPNATIK